jgi:hypothetical protein
MCQPASTALSYLVVPGGMTAGMTSSALLQLLLRRDLPAYQAGAAIQPVIPVIDLSAGTQRTVRR